MYTLKYDCDTKELKAVLWTFLHQFFMLKYTTVTYQKIASQTSYN